MATNKEGGLYIFNKHGLLIDQIHLDQEWVDLGNIISRPEGGYYISGNGRSDSIPGPAGYLYALNKNLEIESIQSFVPFDGQEIKGDIFSILTDDQRIILFSVYEQSYSEIEDSYFYV